MEGLIRWWVRNPVAANLLMLIIVTAGWLGLRDIEKEAFPSVQPDIVQVEIIWPGASPKEVEQQVIQRQMGHLRAEFNRINRVVGIIFKRQV